MKRLFTSIFTWLFATKPQAAPVHFVPVAIETEAAGYLHTQLRLNIRQKERIQSNPRFELRQLFELKNLIPNQVCLVFIPLPQYKLLKDYVDFYWEWWVKDSEDKALIEAIGLLRDELFFRDPQRVLS